MMKKWLAALIVLLIAIYVGSPYYAAYQLKQAYDTYDGDAIAGSIDYERLRPSIQSQLNAKFARTLEQYPLVAQLGGDALQQTSRQFINQAVDNAVTPDNIRNLINSQGQANEATKQLAAAWAIASNQVNLTELIQALIVNRGDIDAVARSQIDQMMAKQAEAIEQQAKTGQDSERPQLRYCGVNCFRVSGQIKSYPVTVTMQRQGLIGWQIVDVVLP